MCCDRKSSFVRRRFEHSAASLRYATTTSVLGLVATITLVLGLVDISTFQYFLLRLRRFGAVDWVTWPVINRPRNDLQCAEWRIQPLLSHTRPQPPQPHLMSDGGLE